MAKVGNRVWYDENADGLQSNSEVGVSGVTVEAYDANDQMINSACLLYTSPSPRDKRQSRMPSSA